MSGAPRVLLVAHGYPPELRGGTELGVQDAACALARRGARVTVLAGTLARGPEDERHETREPVEGAAAPVRVLRQRRADLYVDHWQKGASPAVARAFRALLREERPDVVHVHHWLRLDRGLVLAAAREGVPAVVTLHDHWTSCPLAFRVTPDELAPCDAPAGPLPCVDCAARVPPPTPFVPREAAFIALVERQDALQRELRLARALVAPSASHRELLGRFLGEHVAARARVVPPPCELAPARALRATRAAGEPLRLAAWGHLSRLKGTDLLLDALARLPEPTRVELDLFGAEVEPGLLARATAAHPAARARHHGAYERADLPELAAGAHAFVSGSRARESHGCALDEAVALGLPSVLPRAGAFAARASEEWALFYEPGDPASLAAALARLADEPALLERLARALPRPDDFLTSPDAHASALLALYEEARAAGPPPPDELPEERWFDERMAEHAIAQWDAGIAGA